MQKNRLILLTFACFVLSLALGACAGFALNPWQSVPAENPSAAPEQPEEARTPDEDTLIQETVASMTLYEKICQLLIVEPEHLTGEAVVTSAGEAMQTALAGMPVCGIIYSEENLKDKAQVQSMLANTQSGSKIPLILTCDEEGGRVNRLMHTVGTTYIGPMLDYKDQGTDAAYSNAYTIAWDMQSLGFNFDLAPVADVWSNPKNTVIGDRAYSDDFNQAAELVQAAVFGFHDGGVGTALKHFPGHGDTSTDSHDGAVYVNKTLDQLRAAELLPFQAGIAADSDMVMIGHLICTQIDNQPATFSSKIVTDLLRGELGFDGVVITDGLQMGAMTNSYTGAQIALNAIGAGCDLLLCTANPWECINALMDAVENGSLAEERIDQSVTRILTMKAQRGIWTPAA